MKKLLCVLLSLIMSTCFCACSSKSESKETESTTKSAANNADTTQTEANKEVDIKGTKLEIAVKFDAGETKLFNDLAEKFEAETGVDVDVVSYGDDYESTMKTRMASNQLPDVFQTHGWSLIRYKEYLMNLSDQPWVSDLTDTALGVIQDTDGSIYVLMTSYGGNQVMCNMDVLDDCGVNPYDIKTWDDFGDACEKIKAAGYTPIGDGYADAGVMCIWPGTVLNYPGEIVDDSAAMLDGTYDWKDYADYYLSRIASWVQKGYYNEDVSTMDNTVAVQRLAEGQSAFILGKGFGQIANCEKLNPDGHFALVPFFSSTKDGARFVSSGERDTYGIWKDTKNEAGAKAFLEFMARPENALYMSDNADPLCLKSALSQDNSIANQYIQKMLDNCGDITIYYDNLWDRKYMPSGMWSIFGNATQMIFEDPSEANQAKIIDYLKENYQDLYEASKNN